MNRDQAIKIAQKHAKAKPQKYFDEPFMPHEWVISAIQEAGCTEVTPEEAEGMLSLYENYAGGREISMLKALNRWLLIRSMGLYKKDG